MIGHPAPQTALPPLEGLASSGAQVPGLDPAVFKGKVSVVNVWASWCVPCHDEAPLLIELGKDKRLQLIGINYKDAPDNARRFLGRYGNPYGIVGVDGNGRAGIEWGVYGVPETFIVGREGTIVYKMVGPVTAANIDTVLKVEIDKALKAGRRSSTVIPRPDAVRDEPQMCNCTSGKLEIPGSLAKWLAPRNDAKASNKFALLSAVHLAAMAPPRIRS